MVWQWFSVCFYLKQEILVVTMLLLLNWHDARCKIASQACTYKCFAYSEALLFIWNVYVFLVLDKKLAKVKLRERSGSKPRSNFNKYLTPWLPNPCIILWDVTKKGLYKEICFIYSSVKHWTFNFLKSWLLLIYWKEWEVYEETILNINQTSLRCNAD